MLHRNEEQLLNDVRLQNILSQINAGIAQVQTDGRFVDANDRFCYITGYSRDELLKKTMMEITHPDDLAVNLPLFEKCVRFGESFYLEKRYVRKNGEIIWVNNGVSSITDPEGTKLITAVCIDITNQKMAEKVLRDSEERYYNFIHRSTEGIWRFELEEAMPVNWPHEKQIDHFFKHAFLAECNNAMAQMYGFDNAKALIGARLNQFFPDPAEAEEYFRLFISSEYRLDGAESKEPDREGNPKYFLNNLIGVVEDGMLVRAWGTQRDITEEKKSQEDLREAIADSERRRRLYETITASTPDLIYVFDKHYRFTYANKALLSMWGKQWTEAIGKGLRENGYEEWHAAMHEREIDQVIATRQMVRGEVSFPHAVLGERVYDYIFAPVLNENGEVEEVAGTTRDITEIRKAQESIKQSEERYRELAENLERIVDERTKELHRSNEDLQQFAHVASHDLKEPIRKMRMFAGRLRDEYSKQLPEKALVYINKLETASDRMNAMIEGVLLYSSFNAMQPSKEKVDLNKVMRDVLSDLEVVIERTGASISYDHLPTITGTSVLIHQLFYNLLNNALKFARPGFSPEVSVIHSQQSTAGSFETLIIRDNGIGFSNEEAEQIFGPFIRLHGRDKYEGTGLGLSLCRNIVERHGGTIRAQGERNRGATFIITLPAG
jgi:PAS domain S-box-containing protein